MFVEQPVINATSERVFSLLKLIKSYLRSTMKEHELNKPFDDSECIKNPFDQLNQTKIASDFIDKKERL